MLSYLVIAALWLAWLLGVAAGNLTRSIAVSAANFVGAAAIGRIAAKSPAIVRRVLLGITVGLVFLGLGDLIFTYNLATGTDTRAIREPIYLVGVVLFLWAGSLLPFSMERQGLYPEGFALRVFLIAIVAGGVLVGLTALIHPFEIAELIYAATAFYLTVLFIQQTSLLAGGRIGQSLRELVWALVLGSLARVVSVLGDTPAGPAFWSVILYDLLWMSAMSVLLLGATRR